MRWIDRAGEAARQYTKSKRELALLKARHGRTPRELPRRGIAKPVEAEVFSCCDENRLTQLLREIEAVEWAIFKLKQISDSAGASERDTAANTLAIVDLIYIKRSHGVAGAGIALHFSERTVKRYNRIFLRLVAAKLGFLEYK